MKNLKLLSLIIIITIFCPGCSGNVRYKNKDADDAVSKAIYDVLGDSVYYISKNVKNGICEYDYLLMNEDRETVIVFIETVNKSLSECSTKTQVSLSSEIRGGSEVCIRLKNYTDDCDETPNLSGAKRLELLYPRHSQNSVFLDLSIYEGVKDIEYFSIAEELDEIANEKDIDWNKIWPSLVSFEVIKN